MISQVSLWRKKYALTLLLFAAGVAHSFLYTWSATEFTAFAALLLGIFGGADLLDKKFQDK